MKTTFSIKPNAKLELLIVEDTEVKTGEHSITANFLPEMVVDIRKSAQGNNGSLSSIQYQHDSRNSKFGSNALSHSSTRRKVKVSKGKAFKMANGARS